MRKERFGRIGSDHEGGFHLQEMLTIRNHELVDFLVRSVNFFCFLGSRFNHHFHPPINLHSPSENPSNCGPRIPVIHNLLIETMIASRGFFELSRILS
jgi:hypothetical protein